MAYRTSHTHLSQSATGRQIRRAITEQILQLPDGCNWNTLTITVKPADGKLIQVRAEAIERKPTAVPDPKGPCRAV